MTIFIGADHRGIELKNAIIEYLHEKNIRIEDLGPYELDPLDDAADYSRKVSQAVLQNPDDLFGVLICGSGVGVCIAANRYEGIMCALGFDVAQVTSSREDDHVNVLAIPSKFVDFEKAKQMIDAFLTAKPKYDEKYLRRLRKLDE